jgi:hypothetical protein
VRALAGAGDLELVLPQLGRELRIRPRSVEALLQGLSCDDRRYWLREVLLGNVSAPRAERPWHSPPPLPPAAA